MSSNSSFSRSRLRTFSRAVSRASRSGSGRGRCRSTVSGTSQPSSASSSRRLGGVETYALQASECRDPLVGELLEGAELVGHSGHLRPDHRRRSRGGGREGKYQLASRRHRLGEPCRPARRSRSDLALCVLHWVWRRLVSFMPGLPKGEEEAVAVGVARCPQRRFRPSGCCSMGPLRSSSWDRSGSVFVYSSFSASRPAIGVHLSHQSAFCVRAARSPDWLGGRGGPPSCTLEFAVDDDRRVGSAASSAGR